MSQWGKVLRTHGGVFLPLVDSEHTFDVENPDDLITDVIMTDSGGLDTKDADKLWEVMRKSYLHQPYRKWLHDIGETSSFRDYNLKAFEKSLRELIKSHSIENMVDMPDFLLASMICRMLEAMGPVFKRTLDWHGCDSVCHPATGSRHVTKDFE